MKVETLDQVDAVVIPDPVQSESENQNSELREEQKPDRSRRLSPHPPWGKTTRIAPFRAIDGFRGIAASWVVADHCCDGLITGESSQYLHNPLYNIAIRGQLGVMLFFVISGYCITAAAYGALVSGKPVARYAFERVRRIYPPYLAALLFGFLSFLVVNYAAVHHWVPAIHHPKSYEPTLLFWFANLTLTQSELNTSMPNGVFWSLCYEVAFYAVVGVWLWVAKRVAAAFGLGTGALTLFMGLAGTTCLSLLSLIAFGRAVFPFNIWHEFALGSILFFAIETNPRTVEGYSPRFRWSVNAASALVVCMTLSFMYARQIGGGIILPSSRVRAFVCLSFCLLLAFLRRVDKQIGASTWMRPIFWLGACSYSVYLIHLEIIPFVSVLARRAGFDGSLYWIAFWLQLVAGIVAGRVFYLMVERHFVSSRQKRRLREELLG